MMNLQNSDFWHWNAIKMKQCFNCKAPSSSFIQFWCFLFYNSKLMRWGILYIRWLLEVEGGVARLPEHRQHNTAAPSWGDPPPPAVVINTARGRHAPTAAVTTRVPDTGNPRARHVTTSPGCRGSLGAAICLYYTIAISHNTAVSVLQYNKS